MMQAVTSKDREMRKNNESQRFPSSARLFSFCLRVLETRRPGEKIHDQEVGNILDSTPSDTSHWKRGKKAVRSIFALEELARQLKVDAEVIEDLVEGTIDFDEAWMDFCDAQEELRATSDSSSAAQLQRRDHQKLLSEVAHKILEKSNIASVPVYIPEILQSLPFIQVTQGEVTDKIARSSRLKQGQYCIKVRKGEMRPHTRLAIAREVARIILFSEREMFGIPPRNENLSLFEVADFSNALLAPQQALRAELERISNKQNMIKVLSDILWVPKSTVRARLTFLMLENAPTNVFTASPLSIAERGAIPNSRADLSEDDAPGTPDIAATTNSTGNTLQQ